MAQTSIADFYANRADTCCTNVHPAQSQTFDDARIERLIAEILSLARLAVRRLYEGDLLPGQPDRDLVRAVAEFLWGGSREAFLATFTYAEPDQDFLRELRNNVYVFSAFKNHQFSLAIAAELYNIETGDLKDFERFLADVQGIEQQYNANWLRSEYNTAVASGTSAAQWRQAVAEAEDTGLGYLQYDAVQDQRTRPEHAALDGATYPLSDPFWDTWMPPNGWNCRCDVRLVAGPLRIISDTPPVEAGFGFNPGYAAAIFAGDHPYYDVQDAFQDAADDLFGLEPPTDD